MPASTLRTVADAQPGEPLWEIARLYPLQGHWTEPEYFDIDARRRAEFIRGRVEFLPVPSIPHQLIAAFLFQWLHAALGAQGRATVLSMGTRVVVTPGVYREPDVLVMLGPRDGRFTAEYVERPDLVFEIVSKDDPKRDLVVKRGEYARAGISEYWVLDPRDESIAVLTLRAGGSAYDEHGRFVRGSIAASLREPLLRVAVADVFDAARIG